MKKLLLFLLLLPSLGFSQKIVSDKKEVKDLKVEAEHYTKIIIETAGFNLNVNVGITSGGVWYFYDEETKSKIKFKTDIEVLNYMYSNGWLLKEKINSTGVTVYYLFEKKIS